MKINPKLVDWSKSDAEIARQFNCVPSAVCKRRHQLGIKPAKNYPRTQLKRLETEAKLSERETVHEWLNLRGVPTEEHGKPICLLRRLRIALLEEHDAHLSLKVGSRVSVDGSPHRVIRWGNYKDTHDSGIWVWLTKTK